MPDSTSIQPLVLDEELCSECIDINPMAVLGDAAGPGYVVATDFVVRDSSRRFWVGQYHDMIKVFDQTGKFLRQVGRAGGGPMEFRSPLPIYVDGASRVHVLDPGNSKETVITSAFSLHNEQRMDVAVWGAVPLLDGSGYIVNAVVQTSSGIG
ncbi:MAG: 6-bladed beta-propeller, partial [Gammaproteobacteria bacterium]